MFISSVISPIDRQKLRSHIVASPQNPTTLIRISTRQEERGGEIRILIADDSEGLRTAIRNLIIQHSNDWVVCGEVDNGEEALAAIARLLPDVVLLDVSLPLLNGVKVGQIVKKDHPNVRVVMMSEQDPSILRLMADAGGTPHFLAKSSLGADLIPLLISLMRAA